MNTVTTRLEEIVDRNSRSRLVDVAFATMIAILMIVCVAGMRAAAQPSMSSTMTPASESYAVDHDGACDVDVNAVC